MSGMHKHTPLIGIGMPVHNGERYLKNAVDSILSQTYKHFELVIVDNASTDSTTEICRQYVKQDHRVKHIRNAENIGAAANFNKAFRLSGGTYFKWAAHDDVIACEYLERCVHSLEEHEDAVLCQSYVDVIDENGKSIRIDRLNVQGLSGRNSAQRFSALLADDLKCYEVFGVIRREVLEKTSLIAGYVASDRILRAELGLLGPWRIISEPLFQNRHHPDRSICKNPAHHQRGPWFDPALYGRKIFPHWKILFEYFRVVFREPFLPRMTKIRCYGIVVKWVLENWNWARLGFDIIVNVVPRSEKFIMLIHEKVKRLMQNSYV